MYEVKPQHAFFVGIDSDGCAFDTMELKHKECFIPNIINFYELQAVSKYARQAAEFVNLYSKSRGINRFPALIEALEWLQKRPEVQARGVKIEIPPTVRQWVTQETRLGNPALEAKVKETGDEALRQCLAWSKAVNNSVAEMVRHVPPFPFVRESLARLQSVADVLVVSATPTAALEAEWKEHGLASYVQAICGQEIGTKKEILANTTKYAAHHALMIGDAPGDQKAAASNKCLFFPINPGAEEESWERFFKEGIDRFLQGTFAGPYEQQLVSEFEKCLPEMPPWKVTA